MVRKNPPKAPEQMEKEAQEITFEDTDGNKHKFSALGISYARYREIQQTVSDFLSENDEDTMQETFGEHVEVTLNSDGTSEDREYEHD